MKGLTAYAETVSVYGTERVFIDGDDTPGQDLPFHGLCLPRHQDALHLGHRLRSADGLCRSKSMLYLEARCVMITKGAGVQGLQNSSISCIGVRAACPAASVPSSPRT